MLLLKKRQAYFGINIIYLLKIKYTNIYEIPLSIFQNAIKGFGSAYSTGMHK